MLSGRSPAAIRSALRHMWAWGPAEGGLGDAAQVGGQDHLLPYLRRQIHQRMVRRHRLRRQRVKTCAGDAPLCQCPAEGSIVHQVSPGGVDEDSRGLHPRQEGIVRHVPGLVGDGAVEADDVARLRQLLQRQIRHAQAPLLLGRAAVL